MYKQVDLQNIQTIAQEIRKKLTKNMILSINGPLGVGKTTLIKHILPEYDVTSPSFLHLLYYGNDFAHIDAYMINSNEYFINLDIDNILEKRCLIVEWGDLVEDALNLFDCPILKIELFFCNHERVIKLC